MEKIVISSSSSKPFFLFWAVFVLHFFLKASSNPEVDALNTLKINLKDPNDVLHNWDATLPNPCTWFHVICNQHNSVIGVDLGNQNLSGTLVSNLGHLSNLQYLELYNNSITGKIPEELGNLANLVSLDLYLNNISGTIPSTLGKLQKLRFLRLNNNTLSGCIPVSLTNVSMLQVLDLSNNNLEGDVPVNGSFSSFISVNYQNNPHLQLPNIVPAPPSLASSASSNTGAIAGGVAVGSTLLFAAPAIALAYWRKRKPRDQFFDVSAEEDSEVHLGRPKRFSLRELVVATDNFCEQNIIGEGGFGKVYKGSLADGTLVAIKRKEERTQGGEREFQTEVEMISMAVHRNLLRLHLHFTKHQIAVELSEDGELLGFPADRSFVLNGPTIDDSLMRNHLGHWLFRGTDRYSPRTRHAVVFVRDRLDTNDWSPRYRGIYLALEKITYTPHRVGLAKLNSTCQTKEEFSGGWAWQNNPLGYGEYAPNFVLNEATGVFGSGARPILTFPEPKVLTQTIRDYFVSPKTGPLPRLYQYLYENMTNPNGLEEHIDIGSFVDYFLHSELSENSDAYRRSTYFFKDRNEPINAGPVWDLNLAYGRGGTQTTWIYTVHTFWKRLACNYKFASLVQQRWTKLRSTSWSDNAITSFILTSAEPIRRQLKNCVGWKSDNLQCANVNGNSARTFDDAVNKLISAVLGRALWMDSSVPGFYKKLDRDLCVAVGELPAYNCAADGNDDGCLLNPDLYSSAVDFPEPRKPVATKVCDPSKYSNSDVAKLEKPSIDPCWLSAGIYMTDGSITPFCGGYGFCPEGPGAKCTCTSGRHPPTCARSDDVIVPRGGLIKDDVLVMQTSLLNKSVDGLSSDDTYFCYPLFFLCAFSAMVLGVALAARHKRRRRRYLRLSEAIVHTAANLRDEYDGQSLFYGTS